MLKFIKIVQNKKRKMQDNIYWRDQSFTTLKLPFWGMDFEPYIRETKDSERTFDSPPFPVQEIQRERNLLQEGDVGVFASLN